MKTYRQNVQLKEHHLYGSSRLGLREDTMSVFSRKVVMDKIENGKLVLEATTDTYEPTLSEDEFSRHLGYKRYELSNHLGNFLSTITDRKLPELESGLLTNYQSDITQESRYYPFGMLMDFGDSLGYRFGFNGKENINEIAGQGNWQDYGERIYMPRLGRFPSPDPLIIYGQQYSMLSSYQFASNTPIQAIDLDGLEACFIHGTRHGNKVWDKPQVRRVAEEIMKITNNSNTKPDFTFSWQYDKEGQSLNYLTNNKSDRQQAAMMLVEHIITFREASDIYDEEITLIGYSHGGNVSIQAADILNKEYGIKVNVVTINTPAFNNDNHPENPAYNEGINDMIDFRSKGDRVTGRFSGADQWVDRPKGFKIKSYQLTPIESFGLKPHYLENVQPSQIQNAPQLRSTSKTPDAKKLNEVPQDQKNP